MSARIEIRSEDGRLVDTVHHPYELDAFKARMRANVGRGVQLAAGESAAGRPVLHQSRGATVVALEPETFTITSLDADGVQVRVETWRNEP